MVVQSVVTACWERELALVNACACAVSRCPSHGVRLLRQRQAVDDTDTSVTTRQLTAVAERNDCSCYGCIRGDSARTTAVPTLATALVPKSLAFIVMPPPPRPL